MISEGEIQRVVVDVAQLPEQFPTHLHSGRFWEALGRTVATFGFLEEVLGKAIFSFSATKRYQRDEIDEAYAKWLPTLQKALSDPLGGLITSYEKAVRQNSEATISNLDQLVADLRQASVVRNVLCHGSWRPPNDFGTSIPLFVNRDQMVFESEIDIEYLKNTQKAVAELACGIISTVTHMGWQFPGGAGPGKSILSGL